MEIVFNNLTFIKNKKSILNSINLNINSESIISFIGNDIDILKDILKLEKRPTSGFIIFDNIKFGRSNHISNINEIQKKIGLVPYQNEYIFENVTVLDELKSKLVKSKQNVVNIDKHIEQSIKIVGLTNDVLNRNPNELSYTEKKRLLLARALVYNPEIIILDNFDIGFNYRDKEYFKKLFLKLKNKYKKSIIILSRKVDFLINLVDNVYVINNGNIILSGDKKIFYNNELYKYVEIPAIVEFTNYVRDNNYRIVRYLDRNELIKELYRYIRF